MGYYRILLVDDEEEVRKSIIKKINWEQAGFQVVGDAENGEEALEKVEALEPDVVFTDIRMPYMDGLTLTERIRQSRPSVKVLIFSGFDDFEYAQQAIKLNVTEYILKPVNVEELTAILKRIRENLDREIEQRRDITRLRESYLSSLPILREHFLNSLVQSCMPQSLIEEKCREYGLELLGARKYVAAVVDVQTEESKSEATRPLHQQQELIPISVRQLLEEKLKHFCRFAVFQSSVELMVLAAIDKENSQTGLITVLEDISREAHRILEVTLTIGVGHSCAGMGDICRSYQAARNALGYKAIVGAGSAIYIGDVEPVSRGKLPLGGKEESELIAAIKFGGPEAIESATSRMIACMEEARVHIKQYQAYILHVVSSLTQLMQQYDMNLSEVLGSEEDYFELLSQVQKRSDFGTWLMEISCRIHEELGKERDNTTRNVISQAKQYIQDNYQNPDLSVEMLCRYLHMSPAYFSTMFKKETGQTYVNYLTQLRLDKAVELLNKTDDKTYVIASKVGYAEQNYFSYVFKKRFGVSPTKYRGAKT